MTYQAMTTKFDAVPMHSGRFGEIYERYWSLNPHWDYNVMRYRLYNICMAGWLCRNVPGDFICIGVDYGVAPRMVYDFVGLDQLGKTLHLVDPFTAVWDAKTPGKYANYNTAPDYVVAQYPAGASIKLHTGLAPDVLPLPGVKQVAFAFLDVSDAEAESSSLPILFDQLSPGGAIIVDRYGTGGGYFHVFDPIFARLGLTPLWFPSGQALIFK
jgi:hypothetical protein